MISEVGTPDRTERPTVYVDTEIRLTVKVARSDNTESPDQIIEVESSDGAEKIDQLINIDTVDDTEDTGRCV